MLTDDEIKTLMLSDNEIGNTPQTEGIGFIDSLIDALGEIVKIVFKAVTWFFIYGVLFFGLSLLLFVYSCRELGIGITLFIILLIIILIVIIASKSTKHNEG